MEKKVVEKSIPVTTRQILRSKAKYNMKKAGIPMHRVIKTGYFARNWREYANPEYMK